MTSAARRLRADEGGWALATAMGLMAIMMSVGLATFGFVDTQQRQSGIQRSKETAFNLAEAALNAQTFALAQDWPGQGRAASQFTPCTQASSSARCPTPSTLAGLFTSADAVGGLQWRTEVRDNGSAQTQSFYSDAQTAGAPGYDANGDGRVWVRAQATARSRTRTIVALVRVEEMLEDLPRAAIITGRLEISNNGKKPIVDGSDAPAPTVSVRCTPALLELSTCLGHRVGLGGVKNLTDLDALLSHQIVPNVTVTNYQGGNSVSAESRERLKATAIADGRYYATCPSALPAGRVVWIETGNCSWTGNAAVNSSGSPGVLLVNNGTVYFGGTVEYYGVVVGLNPANTSGAIVQVQGNARVVGGVLVEGQGLLIAGSSKLNVELDPNAHAQARTYVSAGMIQNTWREIKSS